MKLLYKPVVDRLFLEVISVARVRGFTKMRSVNLRFTYLLTYLLCLSDFKTWPEIDVA